jgi:hypothetical protein
MSDTLLNALSREIEALFAPITAVVENPMALDRLLAQIGATPPSGGDGFISAFATVVDLKNQIDQLAAQPSPSLTTIPALLDLARAAFAKVRSLGEIEGSTTALPGLGEDLVAFLVASYLDRSHPVTMSVAVLATLIDPANQTPIRMPRVEDDLIVREAFSLDRFRLDRVTDLVRDPMSALRDEYGNTLATSNDANATAAKLFPRLLRLLRELNVTCRYGFNPDHEELFGDSAPLLKHALIIYAEDLLAGAPAEAGVVLNLSSADRGDLGLVASPFGTLTFTKELGDWTFAASLTADVDVLAYGRHGLIFVASPSTTEVKGSIAAQLAAPEEGPAFILGAPTGSRLEVGGALLKAETSLSEAKQSLALSADVSSSALVIAPGDGDGFLSKVLPAEGIKVEFDLGLAWSNERGLTFRGAGSLEATIPLGLSIRDVFRVPTIYLALRANETGLSAEVSASVGLSIGPVDAVIDRVGLASKVTFPKTGGNLGVADLDLRFKPPTGIGLAIDASLVVGGGFVSFDSEKEEYSGVLQLEIADRISVKAIGILTTRMPDGARGYSFVALIFAQGFTIQLGLGFALTGIGGLLAINRTFDEDALRGGLKNHLLDGVMFPKDPIRNAPEIISNLNKVFPPASGHHLFGPMLQIAWGTPALITANLAVIVEFGARARLLILAQIAAILPKRENDLIRLQMDAIGILDFDQGKASLDATLHDSRLLKKFVLTGDMALRLKWKGSPNFALSVGGLHPAFNPPPAFPKLERIAINLSSGDNPRLRLEAYFALTSNSVQFGARAELYAAALGFSIHGEMGFDVLIQFDPFFFLAGFYAQLQLKRGSTNLFKVRLEGSLAGPRPLHLKGKATFEILWWDVSIRIDTTLVEGETPPLPEPIEVMPRLKEALGNSGNWTSQLPDGQRQVVTLRAKTGGPTDVLLHPLGTLTVKQNVVPLDLDISRFGQSIPAGARRFSISSVTVGGQTQTTRSIKDFFAPAEFLEMTDDEKLSRPSFEQMSAGVGIASSDFTFTTDTNDWLEAAAIEFETSILDEHKKLRPSKTVYKLGNDRLNEQSRFGAAGLSELRRTGKNKYRTSRVAHTFSKEGWSIVATDDLTVQPVAGIAAGQSTNYSQAAEALRQLKQVDPARAASLQILRLSELSKN